MEAFVEPNPAWLSNTQNPLISNGMTLNFIVPFISNGIMHVVVDKHEVGKLKKKWHFHVLCLL